jgi:hypothetical protein
MGKEFIFSLSAHSIIIILSLVSFKTVTIKPHQQAYNAAAAPAIVKASIVNDSDVRVAVERQKQEELKQQIADNKRTVENLAAQKQALQLKQELENIKKQKLLEEVALKKVQQEKTKVQQEAKKNLQKLADQQKIAKEKLAQEIASNKLNEQKRAHQKKIAHERALAAQREELIAGEIAKFGGLLKTQVEANRSNISSFSNDLNCDIHIKLTEDGDLISAMLVKSSGNPEYDDLQLKALLKSVPFSDMPEDKAILAQCQDLILNFANTEDEVSEIS